MKKELTIEHLSAYLPYGVMLYEWDSFKMVALTYNEVLIATGGGLWGDEWLPYDRIKPILRPLSDITKEITHNGETFVPMERIRKRIVSDSYDDDFEHDICFLMMEGAYIGQHRHDIVTMLHKWHFDTFGLIESGLAIDINTIQQ